MKYLKNYTRYLLEQEIPAMPGDPGAATGG